METENRFSRRVWGVKWELSNGTWQRYTGLTFIEAMHLYEPLWSSGVRKVVLRRIGVNLGN